MVIRLEQGADLHMAQLMPLPLTVSSLNKIQSGFTFLVPAHPGSPGKGPLNGRVCVCVIKDYIHTLTCTSKHNIKRFIPASSNSGRRCAEEDLILLPCGCREIPRAIMPSSTEAVVLEISASNCRCRVLSYELRTLAACSGKCSANAPNALH